MDRTTVKVTTLKEQEEAFCHHLSIDERLRTLEISAYRAQTASATSRPAWPIHTGTADGGTLRSAYLAID